MATSRRSASGYARAAALTPERRTAISRAAARARHAKLPPERRQEILEHHIQQVVDCAPQLTAEQRTRLAALFTQPASTSQEEAAAG